MIGKIINDRYLTFLGLFWDVWLLHPQDYTPTDRLNARVDEIRESFKNHPDNHQWRPVIGLLQRQWDDISTKYKEVLASKTDIMLYDSTYTPAKAWPTLKEVEKVAFVCVPIGAKADWAVHMHYNGNNMNEYFDNVPESVAMAGGTPDPTPTPTPDPEPTPVLDGDYEITIPEIKIVIKSCSIKK